ncbi:MAG: HAD-IA family hydrolase [bacterium]
MKTVIFDFDGTLADTFVFALEIANKYAAKYHLGQFTPDDLEKMKKLSLAEIVKKYKISWFNLIRMVLTSRREITARLEEINTFPGLPEMMKRLHEEGYQIAVVSTNSKKNIDYFVNKYFPDDVSIIHTSLNPFNKDMILRKLLTKFDIQLKDALYVGDEIRDIDAAKGAGIKVISVDWGYNSKTYLKEKNPIVVSSSKALYETIVKLFK